MKGVCWVCGGVGMQYPCLVSTPSHRLCCPCHCHSFQHFKAVLCKGALSKRPRVLRVVRLSQLMRVH